MNYSDAVATYYILDFNWVLLAVIYGPDYTDHNVLCLQNLCKYFQGEDYILRPIWGGEPLSQTITHIMLLKLFFSAFIF